MLMPRARGSMAERLQDVLGLACPARWRPVAMTSGHPRRPAPGAGAEKHSTGSELSHRVTHGCSLRSAGSRPPLEISKPDWPSRARSATYRSARFAIRELRQPRFESGGVAEIVEDRIVDAVAGVHVTSVPAQAWPISSAVCPRSGRSSWTVTRGIERRRRPLQGREPLPSK